MSLIEYENTLRRLIIDIVGDSDNADYKVPEDRVLKWKEKRETEKKKYKGLIFENRLLYYSDIYDLNNIVTKNWNLFQPIIHDKKRFDVFFSEIEKFRNTKAHGRNLIVSQENLLKGIVSDLKNLITVYHNKNEMKDDYFVRIIRISDNLGNMWDGEFKSPIPVLRVGDEYEVIVEANDPKDRRIEYKIDNPENSFQIIQGSNRFNFKIQKNFIGRFVSLFITVSTPEAEYPNEAYQNINLTVLPQ